MMVTGIIIVVVNLIILIFSYFIIKKRIEKKLVNQEAINKIKEEINSLVLQLNNTTLNNVSLLDEKIKELNKLINIAEKKKNSLNLEIKTYNRQNYSTQKELFNNLSNSNTYSPENIIKKSNKITEFQEKEKISLDNELEKLTNLEKIDYLIQRGWNMDKIKKKLNISTGEFELLINTKKMFEGIK